MDETNKFYRPILFKRTVRRADFLPFIVRSNKKAEPFPILLSV